MKATGRGAPAVSPVWLVPVFLIAAGVRLLGLGNQDLWGDEAFSVMASLGPPSKLLGLLATAEPHPPLYPFLLVVWLRAFGSGELVARLPSAFAGIASAAVAASLARSFAPPDDRRAATSAAIVAGLLVAVNPFQVWYSQEARMYAQVSFFAGLATLALLRLWRARRWAIPLYALAVVGAAGSHYYGLFVPLAHGLALFSLVLIGHVRRLFLPGGSSQVTALPPRLVGEGENPSMGEPIDARTTRPHPNPLPREREQDRRPRRAGASSFPLPEGEGEGEGEPRSTREARDVGTVRPHPNPLPREREPDGRRRGTGAPSFPPLEGEGGGEGEPDSIAGSRHRAHFPLTLTLSLQERGQVLAPGEEPAPPPALGRWLRASALAALLYLPWVYVALRVFTSYYGGPPGSEDLVQVAVSSWARIVAGWSLEWPDAVRFALILTALAAFGLVVPARSPADRFLRVVLGFWLATPFVLGYVASLLRPLYNERYLIVTSLPFILLVARGIAWLLTLRVPRGTPSVRAMGQTWIGRLTGVAALLAALALAYVPLDNVWRGEYLKSAYDTHVTTVDALAGVGDSVILDGPAQEPLYRYYARTSLPYYTMPPRMPLDLPATTGELAQIARDHSGGWVIWYASLIYDPSNVIGGWLGTHAYLSLDTYLTNARLQYYRFVPDGRLVSRATRLTFADALALDGYAWSAGEARAGETIAVDLTWRALAGRPAQPRVNLRLVDANGFTWGQSDQLVGNGFLGPDAFAGGKAVDDRHGLRVPTGTPPGDYLLLLNVYSADHPDAFPVAGQGAPATPGGVQLATVRVSAPSRLIWAADIGGYRPVSAGFGAGLQLLGYAGSDRVRAGESGYLTLVWKAAGPAPATTGLRQELLDATGRVVQQRDVPLATEGYPPARWQAGDVVREQYRVPVDVELAAGVYRLAVGPVAPDGASGPAVPLGPLQVEPGPPRVAEVPPRQLVQARLDNRILLKGYDLSATLARPGTTLDLTLHWSDLAPLSADYTVFVHVLNSSEQVVAQRDQPPGAGARPTSSWFPGDTIVDPYQLALPPNLPPGDYQIEVGMYNPSNGARLPVSLAGKPAGDRIILSHLRVAA